MCIPNKHSFNIQHVVKIKREFDESEIPKREEEVYLLRFNRNIEVRHPIMEFYEGNVTGNTSYFGASAQYILDLPIGNHTIDVRCFSASAGNIYPGCELQLLVFD